MKNSFIFILLIFTTPLILPGCASQEAPEEKTSVVRKIEDSPVPKERSKTGGYTETSTDSENVIESFSFLKKELTYSYPEFADIKIQKAEIQIVAGWKMKLFCEYSIGDSKELNVLEAIIYKDPDQNITLEFLEINK